MGRNKKVIDQQPKEEKKVTAEMYADIKGMDERKRFVLRELHKKEQHSIQEWNKIIKKEGI